MKTKNVCWLFLVYFVALLISGCTTSSNNPNDLNDDVRMNISFVDQNGKDLLNPKQKHAITEQNTDIYYLANGEKKKVFDNNLDHPKHFYIWYAEDLDTYFMTLFPNRAFKDNESHSSVTYIKFADGTMDTVKVKAKKADIWGVTKVWYNQTLRWDISDQQPRKFTIERDITEN
ncbi:MAG TPA: hypothetical protein VJ964_13640 [Balneolaceae bacterium]|nr:hypothetical protein [Balneolaceae bacterium]